MRGKILCKKDMIMDTGEEHKGEAVFSAGMEYDVTLEIISELSYNITVVDNFGESHTLLESRKHPATKDYFDFPSFLNKK